MSLPLDLVRTLAVVVDEGTLDRAATALSITPSAVSQRIRSLETQVGRVLLARTKPVAPTPDGTVIVRLARQLELLEQEATSALGIDDGAVTTVRLGVNADSLTTWFLPALAAVQRAHPVVFELHREDQERTATLLESGLVMGAVTSQQTPVAGCIVSPIGSMRYEAVAERGFADRWFAGGATRDALSRAPIVDFDRDDVLQSQYLASRGVAGAPPRHVISASAEFARAIELGLGWGLLLPFQFEHGIAEGTLVRLGGRPIEVPLFWQRWNVASALLDAVTDAVLSAASSAADVRTG